MATTVEVNRGSDKTMRFEWKDGLGAAIPLTNPRVIDATSALGLTVVETDIVNGIFEVKLEGTNLVTKGKHSFRVQAEDSGGDSIASPEVTVSVV